MPTGTRAEVPLTDFQTVAIMAPTQRGYNVGVTLLASLPLHPLLVHIPVVLVPLLFAATIAITVRRSWFDKLAITTALVAVVAAFGTLLASQSGEDLQEQATRTAKVSQHVELGDQAKVITAGFLLMLFVWVALDWWFARMATRPPQAGVLLKGRMVLSLVLGAFASTWVFRAGHSGADATWTGRTAPPAGGDNDG